MKRQIYILGFTQRITSCQLFINIILPEASGKKIILKGFASDSNYGYFAAIK
jgi:hypothetical protein